MASFKHNKKRNTGLVYEFLLRRMSKAMVEADRAGYDTTLSILKKYYGEGAVLAEERELFDVVRNTRSVTETAARRILGEVQRQAQRMDAKKIDIKKSNLIKEVNHAFGQGFFNEHRIPEYRLLASVQMVIDASRTDSLISESVARIQLEEGLVHYMTTKGDYSVSTKPTTQGEIDALIMRMVTKRFGEKYSKALSASQKTLLERYIRYQVTGDSSALQKHVEAESARVAKALDQARRMKEVAEDPKMVEVLGEAHARFLEKRDLDGAVENLMLYQKLVEEIEADE